MRDAPHPLRGGLDRSSADKRAETAREPGARPLFLGHLTPSHDRPVRSDPFLRPPRFEE